MHIRQQAWIVLKEYNNFGKIDNDNMKEYLFIIKQIGRIYRKLENNLVD